jgi:hypothetical protein
MAFSQLELDALKSAYAAGALRVTFEGKTVEYGNADDLLKRIRVIEAEIEASTVGRPRPVAGFAGFRRG